MLERLTCVDAACTLSVAVIPNVLLIKRESDSSSVELCSLPPTGVSLIGNVHICHLQVAIWYNDNALLEPFGVYDF